MAAAGRPLRVLLIEDSEDDAAIVLRELRRGGFAPQARRVDDAAGLAAALTEPWQVVLCDYSLPGFDAMAAFAQVRAHADLPFILVSGTVGEEAAVEAMRAGVHDFVLKDRLRRLVPAVDRELKEATTRVELRRAEDALRRTEKLRSLGQMSVGIAHDLKNVLNPLGLHLALIERAFDRAGVARPDAIGKMREVLHHGVQTIDRLRAFSRLEPEPIHEQVDLAAVAREAIALIQPRLPAAITVDVRLADVGTLPGLGHELVGATVNLLINAIDACAGAGGQITVEVDAAPSSAWIAVADNGPGMPPEVEARVFEPFFTTKGDDGTGLGLANVFATTRRHNADIELVTAPGRGARFTLRFRR